MNITLKQLEVFYLSARELNLARAAKIMDMTPPAVTKHIKNLEEICGTKLFGITGRQVYLTEAGLQLFDNIQPLLSEASHLTGIINTLGKKDLKPVTIALTHTTQMVYLPVIREFKKAHPDIHLKLFSYNSVVEINEQLGKLDMDVFITGELQADPVEYEIVDSFLFKLKLYAHKNHPILKEKDPIAKLPEHICAYITPQSRSTELQAYYMKKWGVKNNIIQLGSYGSAMEVVRQNLGLAILIDKIVDRDIQKADFVDIKAANIDPQTFPINVSTHRQRAIHENAALFIDFLKKHKLSR